MTLGAPEPAETRERRVLAIELELRVEDTDKGPVLEGYAARFNSEAQIGGDLWGFMERIEEGAFRDTIRDDDIRALFNHDANLVLGRSSTGTLTLLEDKKGLRATITPPDTQAARDVIALVKRGDVNGMSFGFQVRGEEWQEPKKKGELPKRTLKDIRLFDVGPVTFPAYPTTSVKARDQVRAFSEALEHAEKTIHQTAARARERAVLLAEAEM